jgi:hypothetical protein
MAARKSSRAVLAAEQEMLDVPLHDNELRQRGELLATTLGQLQELDKAEAAIKEEMKTKRRPLQVSIARLADMIRRRAEPRPVLVETVADFERGVAVASRMDTGEAIRERELRPPERQGVLLPMPARKAEAVLGGAGP